MPSLKKLIFKDEPVIGIKSPFDYPYIKFIRGALTVIKSWPAKEFGHYENEKIAGFLKHFYLSTVIFSFIGCVMYIKFHNSTLSFMEIGHQYIIMLMNIVDFTRVSTLTLSQKYRELIKDFLTKLHLFYYKDQSEVAMKTHKQIHLVSHVYTISITMQMIFGLSLFNLIPMYSNYASGKYKRGGLGNRTFEHSLYFTYPFDVSTNIRGYIFANILHWINSYLCSSWFCMFDCILSLMVFQLWGHFKILTNHLDNFPRPKSTSNELSDGGYTIRCDMYSEEELLQVSDKLKECMNYHREIISFTDRISDVFGPTLLVYFFFHQTSGCLLLLECSAMTAQALARYLPLTLILFQQLIQLSVIFELVGTASEKLKHAVYSIPWECMDTKNRKLVLFFLMNVQEPVHVKALGVADVGVTSMATILKTSMSYFTFLRSM